MTNNNHTTSIINKTLLSMCDDKTKKDFLINRLVGGLAVPCFAFTKALNANTLKKSVVSIVDYNHQSDRFISDDGLSYDKVVYLGYLGFIDEFDSERSLTTSMQKKVGLGLVNSVESLDDFDILQHASVPTAAEVSIMNMKSFKDFMIAYEALPLLFRSINDFKNNELEWFYYSTIGTELAKFTVLELLTHGRIINLVEACDRLSCSIEELEHSIKQSVTDNSKCVWSVTDATDWVNCNFVLVYLN